MLAAVVVGRHSVRLHCACLGLSIARGHARPNSDQAAAYRRLPTTCVRIHRKRRNTASDMHHEFRCIRLVHKIYTSVHLTENRVVAWPLQDNIAPMVPFIDQDASFSSNNERRYHYEYVEFGTDKA